MASVAESNAALSRYERLQVYLVQKRQQQQKPGSVNHRASSTTRPTMKVAIKPRVTSIQPIPSSASICPSTNTTASASVDPMPSYNRPTTSSLHHQRTPLSSLQSNALKRACCTPLADSEQGSAFKRAKENDTRLAQQLATPRSAALRASIAEFSDLKLPVAATPRSARLQAMKLTPDDAIVSATVEAKLQTEAQSPQLARNLMDEINEHAEEPVAAAARSSGEIGTTTESIAQSEAAATAALPAMEAGMLASQKLNDSSSDSDCDESHECVSLFDDTEFIAGLSTPMPLPGHQALRSIVDIQQVGASQRIIVTPDHNAQQSSYSLSVTDLARISPASATLVRDGSVQDVDASNFLSPMRINVETADVATISGPTTSSARRATSRQGTPRCGRESSRLLPPPVREPSVIVLQPVSLFKSPHLTILSPVRRSARQSSSLADYSAWLNLDDVQYKPNQALGDRTEEWKQIRDRQFMPPPPPRQPRASVAAHNSRLLTTTATAAPAAHFHGESGKRQATPRPESGRTRRSTRLRECEAQVNAPLFEHDSK